MTLDNILNTAWEKTKKVICGGLLLTQLYSTSLAYERPAGYKKEFSDKKIESLVNVDYYKKRINDNESRYQVEITKGQEGVAIDQIENAWIAVGIDKGEIGEPEVYLQTRYNNEYKKASPEKELKKIFGYKIQDLIIFALSQLPEGIGLAIDSGTILLDQEQEEKATRINNFAKERFGDCPYKLFHIPRGRFEGVTTGYKKILFDIPTKDNKTLDWWIRLETSR